MVLVRKKRAGSSSHGHTWPHDGAVVDVPEHDARELVAIPDGGFAVVEPDPDPAPTDPVPRGRRRPPRTVQELETG